MTGPRVLVLPADETGCGKYRCIWPAEVLKARGRDIRVAAPGSADRIRATLSKDRHGVDHVESVVDPRADVVVVQRPMARIIVEALEVIVTNGVRVVVELDDDFRAVSPRNSAWAGVHPKLSPEMNWTFLDRALSLASALVVTTPSLARRYGQRLETYVVPNYVPRRYLTTEVERNPFAPPGPPLLGWPGNVATHPDDLQVVRAAVQETIRATGATFRVIGPADGVGKLLGVDVTGTGWVATDDYGAHVSTLDVGIAPLAYSLFNNGKSWLKPLELAALGVPVVMSRSDEYEALYERFGIGQLAGNPKVWRAKLCSLLTDADHRAEQASDARKRVRDGLLTIEDRANWWWHAWTGERRRL